MPNRVTYVAFVERVLGKEFRVRFPDFPDVRASHPTIDGVGLRSAQVLRSHIAHLLQADERVPRPASVDEVREDGRYRDGFLMEIEAEVPESHLYTRSRHRAGSSSEPDETSANPESWE